MTHISSKGAGLVLLLIVVSKVDARPKLRSMITSRSSRSNLAVFEGRDVHSDVQYEQLLRGALKLPVADRHTHLRTDGGLISKGPSHKSQQRKHATLRNRFANRVEVARQEMKDQTDARALQNVINAQASSVARVGTAQSVMEGIRVAWVLIFNADQQDEGVYTLQGPCTGCTSACVLAFEHAEEADDFARLLHRNQQGFSKLKPRAWSSARLGAFCEALQFEMTLVPQGALMVPPSINTYDFEAYHRLSPSNQHREQRGSYEISDVISGLALRAQNSALGRFAWASFMSFLAPLTSFFHLT